MGTRVAVVRDRPMSTNSLIMLIASKSLINSWRSRLVSTLLPLAENQLIVILIHLGDVLAQEVTILEGGLLLLLLELLV